MRAEVVHHARRSCVSKVGAFLQNKTGTREGSGTVSRGRPNAGRGMGEHRVCGGAGGTDGREDKLIWRAGLEEEARGYVNTHIDTQRHTRMDIDKTIYLSIYLSICMHLHVRVYNIHMYICMCI